MRFIPLQAQDKEFFIIIIIFLFHLPVAMANPTPKLPNYQPESQPHRQ